MHRNFVVTIQTEVSIEAQSGDNWAKIEAMKVAQKRLNLLHEFSLQQMTGKEVLDILSKTFKFSVIDAREI